jgi:hypothetical protein
MKTYYKHEPGSSSFCDELRPTLLLPTSCKHLQERAVILSHRRNIPSVWVFWYYADC